MSSCIKSQPFPQLSVVTTQMYQLFLYISVKLFYLMLTLNDTDLWFYSTITPLLSCVVSEIVAVYELTACAIRITLMCFDIQSTTNRRAERYCDFLLKAKQERSNATRQPEKTSKSADMDKRSWSLLEEGLAYVALWESLHVKIVLCKNLFGNNIFFDITIKPRAHLDNASGGVQMFLFVAKPKVVSGNLLSRRR